MKQGLALSLVLASLLALSACGGKKPAQDDPAAQGSSAPVQSAEPSQEPTPTPAPTPTMPDVPLVDWGVDQGVEHIIFHPVNA